MLHERSNTLSQQNDASQRATGKGYACLRRPFLGLNIFGEPEGKPQSCGGRNQDDIAGPRPDRGHGNVATHPQATIIKVGVPNKQMSRAPQACLLGARSATCIGSIPLIPSIIPFLFLCHPQNRGTVGREVAECIGMLSSPTFLQACIIRRRALSKLTEP